MAKVSAVNVNEVCENVLSIEAKIKAYKEKNKAVFSALSALEKEQSEGRGYLKTYKEGESFSTEKYIVSLSSADVPAHTRVSVRITPKQ